MNRPALRGGLRLESHKVRPLQRPIVRVPSPQTAVLALDQGSGEDSAPVVRPGQAVRVGTAVAAPHGAAAALHSPVSGIVRGIVSRRSARGIGACIVIDSDGRDEREPAPVPEPLDWRSLSGEALLEHIAAAGIAGLGGAAFPTAA